VCAAAGPAAALLEQEQPRLTQLTPPHLQADAAAAAAVVAVAALLRHLPSWQCLWAVLMALWPLTALLPGPAPTAAWTCR